MSIEVGSKVAGKVSGITNFGAFIDLGEHKTGLVHISEISDKFIKDIHDVLSVGDTVTVKVLSVSDDGKIALSMRKASDSEDHHDSTKNFHGEHNSKEHFHNDRNGGKNFKERSNHNNNKHGYSSHRKESNKGDFDSLLAGFMKQSDERLTSLKRNTEGKRGGRGGRRS